MQNKELIKSLFKKIGGGRLSPLAQYYLQSLIGFVIGFSVLSFFNIDFINLVFFMMSFVWHFSLLTPGLKEKTMTKKQRFSFLMVIIKINYYFQLFIKIKNNSFGPSLIRALSPFIFTLILMVVGGGGNILFTLLGSIAFELTYFLFNKWFILAGKDDDEIPPAIPIVKNHYE